MFVVTIDQRGSRTSGDRVPELLAAFAALPAEVPFERSVGDEIQGVLAHGETVVAAALTALRLGDWYVGIGLGEVDAPLPKSSREGSGSAFISARDAVEAAKKSGERVPLRVRAAEPSVHSAAAEAVLVLVGDVVRRRSDAEWRVVDALEEQRGQTQKHIAGALDISPQAVSKAILRSGYQEAANGARAAALLLDQAAAHKNVGA